MATLEKQITRDLEIKENKDGYWYYLITEANVNIMESDLYQTSIEASCAGTKMLDLLHVEKPLHCDYVPNTRDTLIVYSGGKKNG